MIKVLQNTVLGLEKQMTIKDQQITNLTTALNQAQENLKNQQILSLNEKKTVQLENKQGFFQRLFQRKEEE